MSNSQSNRTRVEKKIFVFAFGKHLAELFVFLQNYMKMFVRQEKMHAEELEQLC